MKTLLIPIGALILGYLFRSFRWLDKADAGRIVLFILKFITPVIILLAIWKIKINDTGLLVLPLIGFLLTLACFIPAYLMARALRLKNEQTGIYLNSAGFSNIGYTLGGFIAFSLFGEAGFGLTVIYCLYYGLCFYIIGFGIAGRFGKRKIKGSVLSIKALFQEGVRIFPFIGMIIGGALNLSNITRPEIFTEINGFLIPAATFSYMFAVGLTFSPSRVFKYAREALLLCTIKFLYAPLIAFFLIRIFSFLLASNPLAVKVIMLESFMPVALSTLVLPVVFDLDQDLANANWLITTLIFAALFPIFMHFLP